MLLTLSVLATYRFGTLPITIRRCSLTIFSITARTASVLRPRRRFCTTRAAILSAPPRNTGDNPWRIIQNGSLNYIEFNDTYVLLKSDGSDPIIGSSPFYIPDNINFKLQSKYKKNGVGFDKYEYEVNLLAGNTIGERVCFNDAKEVKEYIVEGSQTFTSLNNAISCRFESKTLFGTNANLIYVYIDYE